MYNYRNNFQSHITKEDSITWLNCRHIIILMMYGFLSLVKFMTCQNLFKKIDNKKKYNQLLKLQELISLIGLIKKPKIQENVLIKMESKLFILPWVHSCILISKKTLWWSHGGKIKSIWSESSPKSHNRFVSLILWVIQKIYSKYQNNKASMKY